MTTKTTIATAAAAAAACGQLLPFLLIAAFVRTFLSLTTCLKMIWISKRGPLKTSLFPGGGRLDLQDDLFPTSTRGQAKSPCVP